MFLIFDYIFTLTDVAEGNRFSRNVSRLLRPVRWELGTTENLSRLPFWYHRSSRTKHRVSCARQVFDFSSRSAFLIHFIMNFFVFQSAILFATYSCLPACRSEIQPPMKTATLGSEAGPVSYPVTSSPCSSKLLFNAASVLEASLVGAVASDSVGKRIIEWKHRLIDSKQANRTQGICRIF